MELVWENYNSVHMKHKFEENVSEALSQYITARSGSLKARPDMTLASGKKQLKHPSFDLLG